MSIRVNLFEFSKRSNSTLRPSGNGFITDCELHAPLDIMAPVMLFNLSAPFDYNYMFVQDWGRYYWIDSWTYDKGLWHAQCTMDPLSSWRNSIGNMTEYILRSADESTPDIVDTTYPMIAKTLISRADMPGWYIDYSETGSYVIGIVSGNGLVEYYVITNLSGFGSHMFGDTLWNNVIADDPGIIQGGSPSFMKAQFNPLQYVVSCVWYPFDVPHANTQTQVMFGYFESGFYAYRITRSAFALFSSNIVIPEHPQSGRGTYLNMAPYTRMRLSALPWGEVDLDTTKFANKDTRRIFLEAWVDPVTGSSKLYISNGNDETILTLVGQIGVPEQLSQVLKDNLATVNGGISAIAGIASLAGGNISGLATAVSGIGNAIAAQYPDVSTTGTNGARIAVCPTAIWLTTTHQYIVEEDRQNHGRPLCERRRISDLPGYLVVSDPDVEIPATKAEIDKIKEFMVTGFFYE